MATLIGRVRESERLDALAARASAGSGLSVAVTGEPGVGKTTFVADFKERARKKGFIVVEGAAEADSTKPFMLFSKALAGEMDEPVFFESETTSFAEMFAVNDAGLLIAKSSPEGGEGLDADIFAGMLSAVQNFVRDSFGGGEGGLGRLEYGDMKILIEHGKGIFVTAVLKGQEHPEMKAALRRSVKSIVDKHGAILENWAGDVEAASKIQDAISALANLRFQMRRNLEGVKLEAERLKVAGKIMDALARKASHGPLLLVLEDLHWADESSLFVLRYVARNAGQRKLLVLSTTRTGEGQAAQKAIQDSVADGAMEMLALAPMDDSGSKGLVDSLYAPNAFPANFFERLAKDCRGNPFFIKELLRQMADDGAIALKEGSYALLKEDYAVPSSIDEMAQKRLGRLDPDSMTIAEYASCIGKEFPMSAALSLKSLRNAALAMEKLKASGIVEALPDDSKASFSHAIFRGVVYGGIAPRWKSAYHRSLGEFYERTYEGRQDEAIYELARHFSIAGDAPKAFEYCAKAGEKAEGAFAVDDAIGFYEKALVALPKARMPAATPEREFDLRERVGDLMTLAGHLDRALETFKGIKAEDGDAKARMLRKCANVHWKKGDYDSGLAEIAEGQEHAVGALERSRLSQEQSYILMRKGDYEKSMEIASHAVSSLEGQKEFVSLKGDAHQTIGTCYYWMGDYAKALEHYQLARAIFEDEGDLRKIAQIQNVIGNVHGNRSELAESLACYEKSIKILERIGDRQGVATIQGNIGAVYHATGELGKALDWYLKCQAIGEAIGDHRLVSSIYGNIGGVYQAMGQPRKGLEMMERSLALKERSGEQQAIAWCLSSMGSLLVQLGDFQRAKEHLERALSASESIKDTWEATVSRFYMAELLSEDGNDASADALYAKALADFREMDVKDMAAECMRGTAELRTRQGKPDEALALLAESEKLTLEAGVRPEHASSVRAQGNALAAKGKLEEARAKFDAALVEYQGISSPAGAARVLHDWGVALVAAGEKAEGREMLSQAKTGFEKTEMAAWAKKCAEALAKIQ